MFDTEVDQHLNQRERFHGLEINEEVFRDFIPDSGSANDRRV